MNLGPRFAFTRFALLASAVGHALGPGSHAWAVAACLLVGSAASFHLVGLWDPTAYARMRRKHGWSLLVFHGGNVLLHLAPLCYAAVVRPPTGLRWTHGAAAAVLHGGWGLLVSGGTMRLDGVYVPLSPGVWYRLWAAGLGMEVLYAVGCSSTNVSSVL